MKSMLYRINIKALISIFIVMSILLVCNAIAGVGTAQKLPRVVDAAITAAKISHSEISALSKLKNLPEITKAITKYPPETRKAILLAVARERNVISSAEADDLYRSLGKVEGFENVVKLLCAADYANVKGALFELRLANSATRNGHKIIKMRNEFYGDPNKVRTDIDIFMETSRGQKVAIECKSYSGQVMSDMVAKDADTLLYFQKENPGIKLVFSFENKPGDLTIKLLEKKGIHAFWGDTDAQMKAIELLA